MSASSNPSQRGSQGFILPLMVCIAACYIFYTNQPLVQYGAIAPIPAIAAAAALITGMTAISGFFTFLSRLAILLRAKIPTGLRGTAGFALSIRDLKHDFIPKGWGPYFGTLNGKPVFAEVSSNCLCVGPSRSGKGVGAVIPTILALAEARRDKIVFCLRGENSTVLKEALERKGEIVRIVNFGDIYTDILGQSDTYNPQNLTSQDFFREGGLHEVTDDLLEMNLKLLPEPTQSGSGGDNRVFRDGGRMLMEFAELACILVDGHRATIGDCLLLLNNRQKLLQNALWGAGKLVLDGEGPPESRMMALPIEDSPWVSMHPPEQVENFITYYRELAQNVADMMMTPDTRTFDSFLSNAQFGLSQFNITTRTHKNTSRSSFSFSELKENDKPMTVFLVVDASRINAQKIPMELVQHCAFQELKRHPNKHRKVHIIADEATNFKIHDLPGLLTWGGGSGIILHLYIQSLSAFRAVYGRDALNTLLNETEIKQFLAGQRDPETLELLEKLLGNKSVVTKNYNGKPHGSIGLDGISYSEQGRPLMTKDEIRRTKHAILFLRENRPARTKVPPISQIAPWRKQIGINPFYGKPFLEKVTLRLGRRGPSLIVRLKRRLFSHFHKGDQS